MDSTLRSQDVDLIFTKAKPQGQRKLDINAFNVIIYDKVRCRILSSL